jgi:hypothetical protein
MPVLATNGLLLVVMCKFGGSLHLMSGFIRAVKPTVLIFSASPVDAHSNESRSPSGFLRSPRKDPAAPYNSAELKS